MYDVELVKDVILYDVSLFHDKYGNKVNTSMSLVNKKQQWRLVLPLISKKNRQTDFFCFLLPVAFEANGNRHSPGGSLLSMKGQAQIH
jgi:hypothetical protein